MNSKIEKIKEEISKICYLSASSTIQLIVVELEGSKNSNKFNFDEIVSQKYFEDRDEHWVKCLDRLEVKDISFDCTKEELDIGIGLFLEEYDKEFVELKNKLKEEYVDYLLEVNKYG